MKGQRELFPQARGPSGEDIKRYHLGRWENEESRWLHYAREKAVEWLQLDAGLANHKTITSDWIWEHAPPPANCHPSVMGPVFRDRRFTQMGYVKSKRASAHARVIAFYVLTEGK